MSIGMTNMLLQRPAIGTPTRPPSQVVAPVYGEPLSGVPLEKGARSPTGAAYGQGSDWQYSRIGDAPFKMLPEFEMWGLYEGVRRHPQDRDVTGTTFDMLRKMSYVWVVRAIIWTRINQARRFAKVAKSRFEPGFRVVTRDPEAEQTASVQRRCRELEQFILKCGWQERPDDQFERPTFVNHISRSMADSLIFDGVAIQKWPAIVRRHGISEFQAVDVGEIRRCVPKAYKVGSAKEIADAPEAPPKYAHFVQMRNGQPIAEFGREDLLYVTRNSETNLERNDYGISELEVLIRIITGLLFGLDYNVRYFQQNTIPRGFISLVGGYGDAQLEYFRQQWRGMMQGMRNAHRTPIFAMREGQGASWNPVDMSNHDMEFGAWMEFLTNCACMVYLIHPEEIGFKGWSQQKPSLGQGSPEAQLEYGSDKGLVGLLESVIEAPMDEIIRLIDPDFKFILVGAGQEEWDTFERQQMFLFNLGLGTPNRIAAEMDYAKVPREEMWGDAPIGNPVAFGLWQQMHGLDDMSRQAAMQGGALPGQPGAPGAPGGGPEGAAQQGPGQQEPEADMSGPDTLGALRAAIQAQQQQSAGQGGGLETAKSFAPVVEIEL